MRRALRAWTLVALFAVGTAGDVPATARPLEEPEAPRPAWADAEALRAAGVPRWSPRYHRLEEVTALLDGWAGWPGRATLRLDLGPTAEGRPVPALLFGAEGPEPLERRAVVVLVGAPDGRSLSGCEATLAAAEALLGQPHLRADLAVLVVPWAAPDALARTLGGVGDGLGARSGDLDGDGLCAEDGPDDLDGDGLLLEMLLEDPAGEWTLAADGRMPVPAPPGCTERYRRLREGRDDDGDGRYNEDCGGGVRVDRNFPVGWSAADPAERGAAPLAEPTARALAEDLLGRELAAVLVFQGDHGGLRAAAPPRSAAGTAETTGPDGLAELRARFAERTGRDPEPDTDGELATPRPGPRGELLAWCQAVPGALSLELSSWGPRVVRSQVRPEGLLPADFQGPERTPLVRRPALTGDDLLWAEWLDGTRGGLGFAEWRAIELEGGRRAWVGGWEPHNRYTPPESLLDPALLGLAAFTTDLVADLPRLEVVLEEAEREGELVRVRARVRNAGRLPSAPAHRGRWAGAPEDAREVRLSLDLPAGGAVLAGPGRTGLGTLAPGATSASVEWLLRLDDGAPLRLVAGGEGLGRREREVRP